MPQSTCLKVPKNQGEEALSIANRLKLVNKELDIQRDETYVYIPISVTPLAGGLKEIGGQLSHFELSTRVFGERKRPQPSMIELLKNEVPLYLLADLPHAVDFVGDIGIVEITKELEPYKKVIGQALLKTNKNVRTVLAKAGAVTGTYRLRDYTFVAGERKTTTVHREYGCRFCVDVAKTYFSPRLSFEHSRVASLVKDGEKIVDMFSGVGPFAVMIAKTHPNVKVYAVDVNPDAVSYLERNVRVNRVDGRVIPILGDARQMVNGKLIGIADRVIMNLPEKAFEFVDIACRAVKSVGGIVHFYTFTRAPASLEDATKSFTEAIKGQGRDVETVLFSRFVRETAPHEHQVVLDARIR